MEKRFEIIYDQPSETSNSFENNEASAYNELASDEGVDLNQQEKPNFQKNWGNRVGAGVMAGLAAGSGVIDTDRLDDNPILHDPVPAHHQEYIAPEGRSDTNLFEADNPTLSTEQMDQFRIPDTTGYDINDGDPAPETDLFDSNQTQTDIVQEPDPPQDDSDE